MRKAEKRLWFHVSQAKENPGDIKGAQAAIAVSIDIFREHNCLVSHKGTRYTILRQFVFLFLAFSNSRFTADKEQIYDPAKEESCLSGTLILDSKHLGLNRQESCLPGKPEYNSPGP